MIFQIPLTSLLENSCSEQIFGKLTRSSASVHKKSFTIDILLGIIQKLFGELFLLIHKSTGDSDFVRKNVII